MGWTLGKAEKKDSNRINELFIVMLQTIYNTDQVNGYEIYEDQGSRYLMIKYI